MISLEHVRALFDNPPPHTKGRPSAFCDFAGPGDESVLALCDGNQAQIVDTWRSRDTMHSTGKFLAHFRRLGLAGYDIGYGHQLMDRMQEEGFYLQRFNNGSPATRTEIYANLAAEWWSTVGQLIERRQIIIPNDEKLVSQLTSRRKLDDDKGREKLESKADLRAGVLSHPTAPMPSSAQSSSARNHKSTGKPPSPSKKKSNTACTPTICAPAAARPHIEWR
jgi:hypothetical protein